MTSMKWLIASDLHGSALFCAKLMERFQAEGAQKLLLLGDILYHGPRNDLPDGYNPKSVTALLNPIKDRILSVRGNCDAEVDAMVLAFPILADYAVIVHEGLVIYATHGHLQDPAHQPSLQPREILLSGHTHVPLCTINEGVVRMNPGSVSIPKENSYHGYMTLEGRRFLWKDLDGEIKNQYDA